MFHVFKVTASQGAQFRDSTECKNVNLFVIGPQTQCSRLSVTKCKIIFRELFLQSCGYTYFVSSND